MLNGHTVVRTFSKCDHLYFEICCMRISVIAHLSGKKKSIENNTNLDIQHMNGICWLQIVLPELKLSSLVSGIVLLQQFD